jgi:hypothetical protein
MKPVRRDVNNDGVGSPLRTLPTPGIYRGTRSNRPLIHSVSHTHTHTHHAHVSCCSWFSRMHCTNTYFTKMSIKCHQRKTTGCLPVTNKNEPIDTRKFIHQLFFSVNKLDRIVCLHTLCNIYDNLFFQATYPARHLLSRGHFTTKIVAKSVQN